MSPRKEPEKPTSELSFEQARDELVQVVATLEQGTESLEEAVALWERGEELAKVCGTWLEATRAKLDAAREQLGQA